MSDYKSVKEHCYLTFRRNTFCCIEKPDCPDDLEPETPIIPYMLFPIGMCRKKKESSVNIPKVNVVVCYGDGKKKKKLMSLLTLVFLIMPCLFVILFFVTLLSVKSKRCMNLRLY